MKKALEIKTLKAVLNHNTLTKLAYEKMLIGTSNESLRDWLEFKIEVLSDFIFDITIDLNAKGSLTNYSFKTSVKKLIYTVKYTLLIADENTLIKESLKLDAGLREKLSDLLQTKSFSKDTKNLLKQEITSINDFNLPQVLTPIQIH